MAVHVLSAVRNDGRRYQLNRSPRDEQHARTLASRAAVLLSLFCSPAEFAGGKVVVHDAVTTRLVAAFRVPIRSARAKGVKL